MLNQLIQQDTNLWEAWIEFEQFDTGFFGTLYVVGEITGGQTLAKKRGTSPGELVLEIRTRHSGITRTKEVFFTERIGLLSQYDSISIYADGNLITKFFEIEVMV